MAAVWRKNKGIECGLPPEMSGYPWFKWMDSAIEQAHIDEVISKMRVLYQKE